jgi:hypothetical protein
MWHDALQTQGHNQPVEPFLAALDEHFGSDLTKAEKINLINLPIITASSSVPLEATLCDICLAVPRIKEGFQKEKVQLLATIVFQFKRIR